MEQQEENSTSTDVAVEKDKDSHSEFLDNITELKCSKAKSKTGYTEARHALLILIQQIEATLDAIQQACEALDMVQEEALEVIEKLW